MIRKLFLIFVCMLLLCGCASAAYTNLISNAGFENGSYAPENSPDNWTVFRPTETTWDTTAHSGNYAVNHTTASSGITRGVKQIVYPTEGATAINISCYVKTVDVTGTGGAGIYLMYYNDSTYLGANTYAPVTSTTDWTYINYEKTVLPAGTNKIEAYSILNNAVGTAYYDDCVMYDNTMSDGIDYYDYDNFSDNFSDGDYTGWTVSSGTISADDGYLNATTYDVTYTASISYPCNITHGTWTYKYKYENPIAPFSGNNWTISQKIDYLKDADGNSLRFQNPIDGHWWLDYLTAAGHRIPHGGYIVQMAGSMSDEGIPAVYPAIDDWHTVVFVLDENNYSRMYWDGQFVRWTGDKITDMDNNTKFVVSWYNAHDPASAYPVYIDDVEIYRDQYYYPTTDILYNTSLDAVVISTVDTSLSEINTAVDNLTLFEYNAETNTATAHTDIILDEGASLNITDGTLLMDSQSAGDRKIIYYTDAGIYLDNSTIDTTGEYTFTFDRGVGKNPVYKNQFKIVDSTINNSVGLYLDRPTIFNITDSRLTNFDGISDIKIYFPPREMALNNSVFTGYDTDAMIRFTGGEQFQGISPIHRGFDVVDCNFTGIQLSAIAGVHPYYMNITDPDCILNLINTTTNQTTISKYRIQNPIDILFQYQNGGPIEGVNITITNNHDSSIQPVSTETTELYSQLSSQIDESGIQYFGATSQLSNYILTNNYSSVFSPVTSGADGVISGYLATVENESSEMTYTVTIEKDGVSKTYPTVTFSDSLVLTPYPEIVAAFTANNTSATAPETIQFTDASTQTPTSWSWDFNGDSVEDSTDQNPVWTYDTDGSYDVSLTVTNEFGSDTETKTDYIVLTNPYVAPIILTTVAAALLFMRARRRW